MTRPVLASLALAAAVLAAMPPLAADETAEPSGKHPDRLPPHLEAGAPATPVPTPEGEKPYRTVRTRPVEAVPATTRSPEGWFTPPPNRIDVEPPRQVRTERLDATNLPHLTPEGAALVRFYVEGVGVEPLAPMAAGEELPAGVRLRRFPADLVARVPRLGARAYVMAGDAIAIVYPGNRRIGQVLRP